MQQQFTNEEARASILAFKRKQKVKGLKVPVKETNFYHKKIKALQKMYEPVNMQKVITEGDRKVILLCSGFKMEDLQLPEQRKNQPQLIEIDVELNYDNVSNQQILDSFQDSQTDSLIPYPNSFETAGHIAHFNLTPEQAKYKHVIGQITLMRCQNIKTVVNKTEKLHNVYRTPTLEHMAGQKNYLVKMKEVGVSFQFDFEKVYWCSRLQQQRDRVLKYIQPGQCLADLFCGVGPLAVRAAKKGAFVIANDLNPFCHEYLVKNSKSNHLENKIICWNMCARQATKKIYAEKSDLPLDFQEPDHIYMNLPVDAIEFLDVLKDYGKRMKTQKMPLVHVNCFVVADSDQKSKALLAERINKVLPGFAQNDIVNMHHIKNVTVIMRMYCVTLKLRKDYGEQVQLDMTEKKVKQN